MRGVVDPRARRWPHMQHSNNAKQEGVNPARPEKRARVTGQESRCLVELRQRQSIDQGKSEVNTASRVMS